MKTFLRFLKEQAAPKFKLFPNIEVYSLEDFVQHPDKLTENEFGIGAKYKTTSDQEMVDYIKGILSGEKEPEKYKMPHIHMKKIKMLPMTDKSDMFVINPIDPDSMAGHLVGDNMQTIDIEDLKRLIKTRPKELLSQNNKKMKKEGYYVFSAPALLGLALHEPSNQFVVVNTCPGAGKCKVICYAMAGMFVASKEVFTKQSRILNFILNDPDGFFNKVNMEITAAERKYAKGKNGSKTPIFRWHDAGDFFSTQYIEQFIEKVVKKHPNSLFYAYTKVANVVKQSDRPDFPDNFVIRFSEGALPSEEKEIDFSKYRFSVVIPEDMVDQYLNYNRRGEEGGKWTYKDNNSESQFKKELASKYKIPEDSILTYDELKEIPVEKIPLNRPGKWNVIVTPDNGDAAAARHDVHGVLLTIH